MLKEMNDFILAESLLERDDRVLLAVSGGADSVVMAELFRQRGQNSIIAHCNFGLRGKESDEDERFTKALAGRFDMPFFSRRFDTEAVASDRSISIQMAARELRYAWFGELADNEGCASIALAHHLDDQAETFLMQLARGSGLRGLSGIPVKRGQIIRPLMFASRKDILDFALEQGLEWREDASNLSGKYLRNRLRHEALPLLNEIMPMFTPNLLNSMSILRGAGEAAASYAAALRNQLVDEDDDTVLIRVLSDGISPALMAYLVYEWLQPYGFNPEQVRQAIQAFNTGPGRRIHSDTHTLETGREGLFILPQVETEGPVYWEVPAPGIADIPELGLTFRTEPFSHRSLIPDDPGIATIDLNCLSFPLRIRFRRPGDAYRPLGMRGKKKLSDMFIDAKLPVHLKNRVPVILSQDQICWVAGFRIGEDYKATLSTEEVLVIEYKSKNTE